MENLDKRKEKEIMKTTIDNVKAIAPFEMNEFIKITKVGDETMVENLGWFSFEPGHNVSWFKPEDSSAKPVSEFYAEQEPAIESLSVAAANERINAFKKEGLKILRGVVTELVPAGTYVVRI